MDKKGFTLVEVMAVIAVISLLMVIITPVVSDLLNDSEDTLHNHQIDMVVKASKQYMINHSELLPEGDSRSLIYIDDLIAAGVIDNNNVTDPKSKKMLRGCVVVEYNENINQYEYNYLGNDNECR